MNESNFKNKVIQFLKSELPQAWVFHPSDRFHSGIPDLLICWQGRFLAIELKVGKNKLTKLQEIILKKIEAAGGRTWSVYDMEELRDVIEIIKE